MRKIAITALFALIAFSLIAIFVFTLIRVVEIKNATPNESNDVASLVEEKKVQEEVVLKPWYQVMAEHKASGFMPMSNELYIHFELSSTGHSSKKKFFKLSIDKKDSYSLFCVKQTVAKLDLKYFFVNTKKDAKIVVDTTDVSMLHHLVDMLKTYRIGSSFEEIWI